MAEPRSRLETRGSRANAQQRAVEASLQHADEPAAEVTPDAQVVKLANTPEAIIATQFANSPMWFEGEKLEPTDVYRAADGAVWLGVYAFDTHNERTDFSGHMYAGVNIETGERKDGDSWHMDMQQVQYSVE